MNIRENAEFGPGRLLDLVIVGGGPAAFALLLAARENGLLPDLARAGFRMIERSSAVGSGELGDYSIRSDSLSGRFLAAAEKQGKPNLARALTGGPGRHLQSRRDEPVDLSHAAEFQEDLAIEFRRYFVEQCGFDPVVTGMDAIKASRDADGFWVTEGRDSRGELEVFRSRTVVLATGGHQPIERLESKEIAGKPLLPRFGAKTVQSSTFLRHEGLRTALGPLASVPDTRVAIVGGSHSAMASAVLCLRQQMVPFGPDSVTVLHREELRLTYASPQEACNDGFRSFGPDDICARSGRVFPLAGFRCDSRDLLRHHWELGGLKSDDRLRLFKIREDNHSEANSILEGADLIVAALGYRPRALPLFDSDDRRIPLLADGEEQPLVDGLSRVLDSDHVPIPGIYALGLACGYPMAGVHGEASFKGEANGLALWQGEVGKEILRQILNPSESVDSKQPALASANGNET